MLIITHQDVLKVLNVYNSKKGGFKQFNLRADQKDIEHLKKYARNDTKNLLPEELTGLLKVLFTHSTEEGHASRKAIDTLTAMLEPTYFAAIKEIFTKRNDLQVEEVNLIQATTLPKETAAAYLDIVSASAMTPSVNDWLNRHPHPKEFAKIIIELHTAGILTDANVRSVFENTFDKSARGFERNASEIVKALAFLMQANEFKSADGMQNDVRILIERSKQPLMTAEWAAKLVAANVPLQGNVERVSQHIYPEQCLKAIISLHEEAIAITNEEINKRMIGSHPESKYIIDSVAPIYGRPKFKMSAETRDLILSAFEPKEVVKFLISLADANALIDRLDIAFTVFSGHFTLEHLDALKKVDLLTKENMEFLTENYLHLPQTYLELKLSPEVFNTLRNTAPQELRKCVANLLKEQNVMAREAQQNQMLFNKPEVNVSQPSINRRVEPKR